MPASWARACAGGYMDLQNSSVSCCYFAGFVCHMIGLMRTLALLQRSSAGVSICTFVLVKQVNEYLLAAQNRFHAAYNRSHAGQPAEYSILEWSARRALPVVSDGS